jgi:PAS domain S-box-containing protein
MTQLSEESVVPYPLPPDEEQRLEALAATGLLDTPPESSYDDIVMLAARICQTPVALVTLIGRDRQWFKARVGTELQETPRSLAFCNYPVAEKRTCVVPDTMADPRFHGNLLVVGEPHVRFYAGAPLISAQGHAFGSLCVVDMVPRHLSPEQVQALEALARQVVREIQMREQVRDLQRANQERTAIQEAIWASESVLRSFYDSSPFMMGVVELRGEEIIPIAINRASTEFAGRNSAEMINRSAADYGTEVDIIKIWVDHYRESLRTQSPVVFEYNQLVKGSSRLLSAAVSPIAQSNSSFPRFSYIIQDVTAARRAQEALAMSEQRLRYALDATAEGVWDWDVVTNKVFYSPRCLEMLGYGPTDVPPTLDAWKGVCHPEDLPAGMAIVKDYFENRIENCEFEHRCRHKDGHYLWILSQGKVVQRDENGRVLRIVGTSLDVTERRRAKEELQKAKEEAQNASASKSQFLANMSHEIRTPMTAILGYADLLETPDLTSTQRDNFLQTIRRNGHHLLKLINDILDLSKIEAEKVVLEQIACSPGQLISECAGLIRGEAENRGLRFSVELAEPLPEVIYTDPTRLRQILNNLLGNSLKFTHTGSIRLLVHVKPGAGEPQLFFEVVDTGIGLRPEQLARLFQPFTQADSTTTRKFGGTGLGLAISRRLAQMLGGDISVTSVAGQGSRVTFWMPMHVAPPLAAAVSSAPAAAPTSPLALAAEGQPLTGSILFAEDGPDNQLLIRHVLQRAGAAVTVADNGRIAVEKALAADQAGTPFDLILMDMQMPELDGYDATRLLRQKGVRTPIVALTANAMSGDREECLAAGCNDFATKPIDVPDLLAIIRRNMRGKV